MRNIFLIVLDSVRRDFFLNKNKKYVNELETDFVEFVNCESIYTTTCMSHYTIFFGDYWAKARNNNFPAQIKSLGFQTRSFCNGAIIMGYPLKHILEPNLLSCLPFREDIIKDLGIVPEYSWNRKLFGSKFKDYNGAADDEKLEIPKGWKNYIRNNYDKKNFIFLHFWKAHYNYGINEFVKEKIVGKDYKEMAKELICRIRNKKFKEKFVKYVYLKRIFEITKAYIKNLIYILKETGVYNDSLIIITSDHGEGLGDTGKYLSRRLYSIYMSFTKIYDKIRMKVKFLPNLKTHFHFKWDFATFFHGEDFKIQKEIPLFIKFLNNEFGGKKCTQRVNLLDIIHTVNDLIGNKLELDNNTGCSLYFLLKKGERAREMKKLDSSIKNLISLKKI